MSGGVDMTKTNAKKGMIQYKKGLAKEAWEYGFLSEVNYDEANTLYNTIAVIRLNGVNQQQAHEELKNEVRELKNDNEQLRVKLDQLDVEVKTVIAQYHEALKGVLTR